MEGKHLKAGQILKYVMTDYYTKHYSKRRAMPVELIDQNATTYDVRKYIELVAEICNSVTEPFGYTLTTK